MRLAPLLFLISLIPAGSAHAATEPVDLPAPPTVWDRMMEQQSYAKMREGFGWMAAKRYDEAVKIFAKAVLLHPEDPKARMLLGSAYYWSGDVALAMTEYKEAIRLDPKEPQAHQLLAIAQVWTGDMEAAHKSFQTAANLGPDQADIQMNLGSVNMSLGRVTDALVNFRAAVRLEPGNPLYHHQLGLLYSRLRRDADALEAFDRAIKEFPRFEDAILEAGAVLERMHRDDDARERFKKAVRLKPRDNVARFRWALNLWRAGERDKAAEALEEAFWLTPDSKGGGLALNLAFAGAKKAAAAKDAGADEPEPAAASPSDPLEVLRRNLKRIPLDQEAKVEVSLIEAPKPMTFDLPEASGGSALKKALARAEKTPESTTLGVRREFNLPPAAPKQRAADIDRVIEQLRAAAAERGEGADMRMGLNIEYGRKETSNLQRAGAEDMQERSRVSYQPRDVGNDLGLWVKGSGWLQLFHEVIPDLEDSLVEGDRKGDAGGWTLLGVGFAALGEPAVARKAFERALEFAPGSVHPHLGLAVAHVMAGDEAAAVRAYEEVLRLDPGNRIARRSLEWLKR